MSEHNDRLLELVRELADANPFDARHVLDLMERAATLVQDVDERSRWWRPEGYWHRPLDPPEEPYICQQCGRAGHESQECGMYPHPEEGE